MPGRANSISAEWGGALLPCGTSCWEVLLILHLHALVHRLTVFCITYHISLEHLPLLPNSRPKIPKVEAHGKRVVTRHEEIWAFPPCSFHLLPVPFVTRCPVSRTGVIWRIGFTLPLSIPLLVNRVEFSAPAGCRRNSTASRSRTTPTVWKPHAALGVSVLAHGKRP